MREHTCNEIELSLPKLSFEEIMKQENAKPKNKLSTMSVYALEKVGKDFAQKRAWGMAPEEEVPTDFAELL